MELDQLTLGERLMISRRRAGFTGKQLADKLRVSPTSIVNWENDVRTPPFLVLDAWARLTHVGLGDLDPDLDGSHIRYSMSNPDQGAA